MLAVPFHDLPRLAKVILCLLGTAAVALAVWLWPEWRQNPDLSHGLLMPIIFAALVYEARQQPAHFIRNGLAVRVAVAFLLCCTLAALAAAGLYAASVDWSHPLVDCSLTMALVTLLAAGLLVFANRSVGWLGCNWTGFVAIVLWLLCTPMPPGTYSRLTIALQLGISEAVLRTLHVLGIAAIRHGNIIELGRATVGVEEACSGIRSLISCVFAGFLFSGTLVRRPWARAVIILLSVPLALLMNFFRALTLTLLADHGTDIAGSWHDATGFAVLAVTAALLAGAALLLERANHRIPVLVTQIEGIHERPPRGQFAAVLATLAIAAVLVFVSAANTRPSVRRDAPVPDLQSLLPAQVDGWEVSASNNLYEFQSTLHTDHLAQRIYRRRAPDGSLIEVILYVAYWRAGQAPVSLVASHTPDACWPGSGWTAEPVQPPHVALSVDHRTLADAEQRLFTFNGFPQYVWFWHLYDGRPLEYRDPYSPIALLRIAWKYGFRHDGDQLFVRVSSNRPWSNLASDPLLAEFFRRTRQLGL